MAGSRNSQLAIVVGPQLTVHQDPIGLGQVGGANRRHFLEFLAKVLNFVGVVSRDFLTECALDLCSGGRRLHREQLVVVLHSFLNSAMLGGAAESSRRSRSRCKRAFFLDSVVTVQ